VGESGQGGVSRRVCPSDGGLEQYSPVKARVAEIRLEGCNFRDGAVESLRESAADDDEGPGQSLRCGKVRLGSKGDIPEP
jgi:hypothetical protein